MASGVDTPRGSSSESGRLTEDELLSVLPARSVNREARVGIFVLIGVAAFLIALFTFTDVGTFRGRYYVTTTVPERALTTTRPCVWGLSIGICSRSAMNSTGELKNCAGISFSIEDLKPPHETKSPWSA